MPCNPPTPEGCWTAIQLSDKCKLNDCQCMHWLQNGSIVDVDFGTGTMGRWAWDFTILYWIPTEHFCAGGREEGEGGGRDPNFAHACTMTYGSSKLMTSGFSKQNYVCVLHVVRPLETKWSGFRWTLRSRLGSVVKLTLKNSIQDSQFCATIVVVKCWNPKIGKFGMCVIPFQITKIKLNWWPHPNHPETFNIIKHQPESIHKFTWVVSTAIHLLIVASSSINQPRPHGPRTTANTDFWTAERINVRFYAEHISSLILVQFIKPTILYNKSNKSLNTLKWTTDFNSISITKVLLRDQ